MNSIKIQYESTIRRARLPDLSWQALVNEIATLFAVDIEAETFTVQYKDCDGDVVTINSTEELLEASRCFSGSVLRVRVTKVKSENSESKNFKNFLDSIARTIGNGEVHVSVPVGGHSYNAVQQILAQARDIGQVVFAELQTPDNHDDDLHAAIMESLRSFRGREEQDTENGEESKCCSSTSGVNVSDIAREAAAVARSRSRSPRPERRRSACRTVPKVSARALQSVDLRHVTQKQNHMEDQRRGCSAVSARELQAVELRPTSELEPDATDDEFCVVNPESEWEEGHALLLSMGFCDRDANERALNKYYGRVEHAAMALVQ